MYFNILFSIVCTLSMAFEHQNVTSTEYYQTDFFSTAFKHIY